MSTPSSFWRSARAPAAVAAVLALAAMLLIGPAIWSSVATRVAIAAEKRAAEVHIGDEGVQVKAGTHAASADTTDEEATSPVEDSLSDSTGGITGDVDIDHGNDIVKMGNDITVKPGKRVEGSVVAIGGSVTVYGEVAEDVVAIGGDVTVHPSGVVHGDAVAIGGTVNEEPGSSIGGENVSIGFGVLKLLSLLGVWSIGLAISFFLVLLLCVGMVIALARNRLTGVLEAEHRRMGASIFAGFLITLLFIPATILLCVTVIGIPAAMLLVLAYPLACVVGIVVSGIYLGRRLKPQLSIAWAAVLGLGLLVMVRWIAGVLMHIPGLHFFGGVLALFATVAWLWAWWAGLGAIWLTRFGNEKRVARLRGETPPPAGRPVTSPPPSPAPAPAAPTPPNPWEGPALGAPALPASLAPTYEPEP